MPRGAGVRLTTRVVRHDQAHFDGGSGRRADARDDGEHEQRASVKDAQARDLRRQIEELRAQLARYAEALDEDLASGREKVAARTREGLAFEKSFGEISTLLLNHLKSKPEARDLLQDLLDNMHGTGGAQAPGSQRNGHDAAK